MSQAPAPSRRRWILPLAAAVLVAALVGGRWLALETAERAWAATLPGGAVLIEARTLARLLHALVIVFSIAWATGNVFVVYRAIGSVQLPRRLGDLEIVEAVPQRVLLLLTIGTGIVGGIILAWGTGDWWRAAVLAATPPHFGVTDEFLHNDLGYYVGVLPWHSALQGQAMAMTLSAAALAAMLYAGIGSLRFQRGKVTVSEHARSHLAVLLACLALVIAWGAALDPAEVVAGLHGPVDQTALDIRRPGAPFVAAIAVATALASLVWGWRDRPALILGSWAGLLLAVAGCYLVVPGIVRASGVADGPALVRQRAAFERLAFGLSGLGPGTPEQAPPGFAGLEDAVREVPLWDATRVAQVTGTQPSGVRLMEQGGNGGPAWLVVPLAPPGAPRIAVEVDTGLVVRRLEAAADSSLWFGPGFSESALASPAAWPGLHEAGAGIPLAGAWRRLALAWALQGLDVTRDETDSLVLLWRRDVADRLGRVAPFATFGEPVPALSGGAVWWVSWGYVTTAAFPLTRQLEWRQQRIGSLRAGLIGAVRGATGETRLWLAPGYDSLTAAWARHFEPLVESTDRLPAALREQLEYPTELFRLAAAQLVRASGDSAVWTPRPQHPARIAAPDAWTMVGIEAGTARRFVGVLAGTVQPTGPRLLFWRPSSPERLSELVGSPEISRGQPRIWPAGGAVFTAQAQFLQPVNAATPPRLTAVYLSLGDRTGEGATRALALRNLTTGTRDTSLTARWELARRLMTRADSALTAGNLELFGQIWKDLMRLLAPAPRPR